MPARKLPSGVIPHGTVYHDADLPVAYVVSHGRRGYTYTRAYQRININDNVNDNAAYGEQLNFARTLEAARGQIVDAVCKSIETMAHACDPSRSYAHLGVEGRSWQTVCGGAGNVVPVAKATCPYCLARARAIVENTIRKVGVRKVEAAAERLEARDTLEALE